MGFLATFLEGVATFVSPCLLPLLPVYLAYFAGASAGQGSSPDGRTRRTVMGACAFVLGFGCVFTLLGAFAGTLGRLMLLHRRLLDLVGGAIVVLMGLNMMGVLRIGALERTWGPQAAPTVGGVVGPLLFGVVFAVGWTPCVGPFLATALSLAAVSGSAVRGVELLACYSLGLGVPFVLAAVLIDQLEGAFAWVKAHYALVNRVCGALLVAVGLLMACGLFGRWMALFS